VCSLRISSAMLVLDRRVELGERCMRPARSAGQIWHQARDRSAAVSVERAQVNVPRGAAGGAINPQEVVPGCKGGADCWREQQGHSPGLALVPSGD
jgi:hypothetical protein